ncbi:MAG: hypothetical protein LDL41_23085 [Coleofasciculus sp. S288]|nr:hypothetical protein [Coleofasciculus sp. S288]
MSRFDSKLNASHSTNQPIIKVVEPNLIKDKSLTSNVPKSGKTTYLPGTEPSIEQTYYWLTRLARQLKQDKSTEFLIETMQPSWLENSTQKGLYQVGIGLITGLIVALIYVGTTGLIGASIGGLSYGVILGCTQEIYPITRLKFSLEFTKSKLLPSILEGLWWGLIYGIIDALICWLLWGLKWLFLGMADSLVWGLIEGFIWGMLVPRFYHPTVSNQAIKESALNAGIFTVIGGLAWVVLYMGVLIAAREPLDPLDLLIDGIGNGVFFGIYVGGLACIQHVWLHLILKQSGAIPWNYAKFLDYATELGFLEREGGRYRFINDTVQEYFAQMPLNDGEVTQD